ncbi:hydrolase [Pseudomonas fluorescens]|uniref:linear amide C-N hydrolase n=1 Tax=Pseudomonas fluorescens TaxID=294 RepID=UPI00054B1EEF|nr:linear amide C-N hydrolase [Pseudomonas fluorescens]KII33672.1 hydrolase [Pseudomonas fluorescens]
MKHSNQYTNLALAIALSIGLTPASNACTRALYVGADGLVLNGRSMDWSEDMHTNMWVFPAGMERDGAAGKNTPKWVSKYGSVIATAYDIGSTEGMNSEGLVANVLYLDESDYGKIDASRPHLSISTWGQYVLDNFASVADAVDVLKSEPFQIIAPILPNGTGAQVHLALSDSTGDSAVLEYVAGKLVIHHGKEYTVMTNSPTYDKQRALNEYWQKIGGLTFLPGTNRAADRYARASFLIDSIPKNTSEAYIGAVPEKSYTYQAVASVLGVIRSVSVPLGITTPNEPNIASTLWRTVSDQTHKVVYFDSATRPNTFWISLDKLDLRKGAPVLKLALSEGQVYSGEASTQFKPSAPFTFLQVKSE